jgi:anti-anti-sigma regulatory factor
MSQNFFLQNPSMRETSNALSMERDKSSPELEIFVFSGVIDARAEQLLLNLPTLVATAKVRFDFSRVKRINSMGIALLLRCFKRIREEKKADLLVANLNQVNIMLFRMTGVFHLARLAAPPENGNEQ